MAFSRVASTQPEALDPTPIPNYGKRPEGHELDTSLTQGAIEPRHALEDVRDRSCNYSALPQRAVRVGKDKLCLSSRTRCRQLPTHEFHRSEGHLGLNRSAGTACD